MSDIFREVDEALQQEKLLKIWKEYSPVIIGALVILILSTATTSFYRDWNTKRDAAETARLSNALQADDPHAAINAVIKDTRKTHKALGLMSAANLHLQDNNSTEAAALFQQIAEDKKTPRNIRDLARVLYIQNAESPDTALLKPLLNDDKSPWVWHARVEAAVFTAHNDKNYTKALSYLKPFEKAKYVPTSLKQRALALADVYTLKLQKAKQAAPSETSAKISEETAEKIKAKTTEKK